MPCRPPTLKTSCDNERRPPNPRPAPSRRGYGRDWQRCRLLKITDDPWCELCLRRGLDVAAEEVDHIKPIAAGGELFDRDNLQSLCKSCHSHKTATNDGGFGHSKGEA